MGQKRNAFLFIFSLLILGIFGQLIAPEYFYRNMNEDERKLFNMQENEAQILVGPPTIDDLIPKEKDLTIFLELMRKFDDLNSLIVDPKTSLTIFAPTNSAFRKLTQKPNQVTDKSEDPTERLREFTLGFIVPKSYSSLPDGKELDTLSKTKIKVVKNKDGTFKLNERVNTISKLKEAVNGNVYKIDGILEEKYDI
jgi:uncharacterized surface protein with fasciclin (FAS1) repeats